MDATDVKALQDAYASGGWLAVAATAVLLVVKVYRSSQLTNLLPLSIQWDNLNRWVRLGIVAGTSAISSILLGLAAGQPWSVVLLGVIPTLLGAVGGHELLTTVGKAKADSQPPRPLNPTARNLSIRTPPVQ